MKGLPYLFHPFFGVFDPSEGPLGSVLDLFLEGFWTGFGGFFEGGVLEIGSGAAFKGGVWSGRTQGRQIWGQILIENRSIFDVF